MSLLPKAPAVHPLVIAMLGLLPFGLMAASAQSPRAQPPPSTEAGPSQPGDVDALRQRERELEALRAEQRKAQENEARLRREIEALADDRRKFNQQIIDTASRVVGLEERITKAHARLAPLDDSEQGLRSSLDQRRNLISEVLAALQRIGRQAPSALIRAEDALSSVRSAMMLGAVLPEMRQQAEALAVDLAELLRLRKQIAEERESLGRDLLIITDERRRLSLMIEERQKRQTEVEQALVAERLRAGQLARQAENLNQLIAKLEQELESAARAAAAAARAAEERKPPDGRQNLAALKDPGRLTPAIAFASAKGMLPLPVKGTQNQGVWSSGRPRRHRKGPLDRRAPGRPDHGSM